MKRLSFYTLILSLFLLQACGPSLQDQNLELRAQVIAVHDEVMPKMGQLKSLEKEAIQKAEELNGQDSTQSAKILELRTLASELDQAYEGMFVWMRQYEAEDGDQQEVVEAHVGQVVLGLAEGDVAQLVHLAVVEHEAVVEPGVRGRVAEAVAAVKRSEWCTE